LKDPSGVRERTVRQVLRLRALPSAQDDEFGVAEESQYGGFSTALRFGRNDSSWGGAIFVA